MHGRHACSVLGVVVLLLAAVPAHADDILIDGSFDAGSGAWSEDDGGSGAPLIVSSGSPVPAHTPPNLARLGGVENATLRIFQDVLVPAETIALRLEGVLWIATLESLGEFDELYAEIRTPEGVLLESLGYWSNLDETGGSWVPFQLDAVGDYAGQVIRLELRGTNDGSLGTDFWFDSLVLDALVPLDVLGVAPRLSLSAAMPNPARTATQWSLTLHTPARVSASIFDLSGRRVRRVADGHFDAGAHILTWDGMDATSRRVAPGMYVCSVEAGRFQIDRAVIVVR